ncbi:MAG: MBOAT family protein [Lachnospiraceae bacterium]|nr:MBOAT family protein [Lachnospiraceae bacterium]
MLFNSINFIIFFPVVALVYFAIPKKVRHLWLLLASYFFYMCWNAKYAALLFYSTAVTYASGLLIDGCDRKGKPEKRKKFYVGLSFAMNLSLLFLFKYFDFAVDNINFILARCHLQLSVPKFDLLLPVGISFYIFQALSYTMDVYRKDIYVERNFLKYALFVSFFPQLVAGPIERSKNLLKQIGKEHVFSYEDFRRGLLVMLWGYFQKIVIADRIGILVDTVYGSPGDYQGAYYLLASVLFAIQIYCDFSGYSLIAVGAAQVMGFRLMENFDCPYFAKSVAEFWRRWHISLTSWFRDYLYIPLGGNRKGTARKYVNIMIVFLVSGLWHGAQWTYVVWGGLNGLFQVVGSLMMPLRERAAKAFDVKEDSLGHKFLKTAVTFVLVDFTWIFFRAESMSDALHIIKSIFTVYNPWIFLNNSIYKLGLTQKQFHLLVFSLAVLLIADWMKYKNINFMDKLLEQNIWCRWPVYILGILFVLIFGIWGNAYDAQAFVYFQF